MLIWHKTNATYAAMNAQYKQRHEPCLYWKPKGKTLKWIGKTTESTIWEIKKDPRNEYHPTQKPVALSDKAIKNHDVVSGRNDTVGGGEKECTYIATCNCMLRKEVASEIGGFDPYYKFGGEDADFGYTILKTGYANRVDFNVGVHHHRSVSGRYPDETYRYHLTRVRFNLKHFSVMRNIVIFLIDFF